ncbi:MAG TPA: condensation domain-containing protein, partial [Longimicrobiaceae bacterium]
ALRRAGEETARPFDLATGPLFRARLLRLGAEDHMLLLVMHHIVTDWWSTGILVRELTELYGAYRDGRESPLAELPVQYADYATWQREQLQGETLDRELAYWKEHLAGAPARLDLPTDRPRPATQSHRGAHVGVEIAGELPERLRAFGQREGATLYMVLLAAWQVVLGRYAGTEDVVVGTSIAGRTRREVDALIGFFANTLVLRTDLSGNPTFREVLRRVREVTLGAYDHQEVPFEKLVAELQPERSMSHSPLFQTFFAWGNTDGGEGGMAGLRTRFVGAAKETARFDLTLGIADDPRGLRGYVEYSTDLFDRSTMQRMVAHLERVLEQIADDADARLGDLELPDAAERRRLVEEWSGAGKSFPIAETLHGRFEAQAAARPDAVAVTFGDEKLTYGQLNRRANRLARRLRALGVGPESRVGLCAERSPELVAGVLAILKAGAAYVPLDPGYPAERLAYLAEDADLRVVLAQEHLRGAIPGDGIRIVALEDDATDDVEDGDLSISIDPQNLAYVIYSSGSTGRPKGVGVTHANVLRLFAATDEWFRFGERDAWTLFHSYAF